MAKSCSDCIHLKRIRGDLINPPEVFCPLEEAGECDSEKMEEFSGHDDYEDHPIRCDCPICREDRRQQMLDDPEGFEKTFSH